MNILKFTTWIAQALESTGFVTRYGIQGLYTGMTCENASGKDGSISIGDKPGSGYRFNRVGSGECTMQKFVISEDTHQEYV